MRIVFILFGIISIFGLEAQFVSTDSLNFCEDSTTHNYMKYGNVTIGNYTCGTNKSIRIGNSTGADSVVFNLAVTLNTDSIKLELGMPWKGGAKNPKVWVENFRNDTVPYMGVGNCVPVFIKMGGLASRTNDGMIKVKLMDTIAGFTMDGQFTYIKVYSKFVSSTGIAVMNSIQDDLEIYPNPSTGVFYIKGNAAMKEACVLNALGEQICSLKTNDIDISSWPNGVYFVRIGEHTRKIIKE